MQLTGLKAKQASLGSMGVESLPRGLRVLILRRVDTFAGLPSGLEVLQLNATSEEFLHQLPRSLRVLNLGSSPKLLTLEGLPDGLESLGVEARLLRSLEGLPVVLGTLRIRRSDAIFFARNKLPAESERLRLTLPSSIRSLDLIEMNEALIPDLPDNIEELRLGPILKIPDLPRNLRQLVIEWPSRDPWTARELWRRLPRGLERLSLVAIKRFGYQSAWELASLPPGLHRLDLPPVPLAGLEKMPEGLETLCIAGAPVSKEVGALPKRLRTLDISGTNVQGLALLPRSLKRLAIHDTRVHSLEGLPEGLEELTLSPGQVETLEHLPKSVKRLAFIDELTTCETGPFWEPLFPEFEDF